MPKPTDDQREDRVNLIKILDACMDNPSIFAKTFLKIDLFPYQVEYADCKDRFIVCRQARQSGKCIEENEYIYTPNGIKRLKDIKHGDYILGGQVLNPYTFEDDLYNIIFQNGVRIKVNSEHPFMTKRGWIKAKDLKKSDKIQFMHGDNVGGDFRMGKEISKLFGYLYSDGYYREKQAVKFTNNNKEFLHEVEHLATNSFNIGTKTRSKGNGYDLHLVVESPQFGLKYGNPLIDYIRKNNLMQDDFGVLQNLVKEDLIEFIKGYFNGDGCLYISKPRKKDNRQRVDIFFAIGNNRERAHQFQYMLWRLGIDSIVKSEIMKKGKDMFYRVISSRKNDIEKLIHILDHTKYPEKFERAKKVLETINQLNPKSNKLILYEKTHKWVKMRRLELTGKGNVVGFEVNPTHEIYSYLGMRTHNTTTTAVKTIHFAWFADYLHELVKTEADITQKAICNMVIVAPTQNQANIMFGRIRDLIHTSDILEQYVIREKSDEIHLRFASGRGVTKIFTRAAGDKGTSLRGYSPHVIIADECAFLKEEVLAAFMPAGLATNARVWLTSTPFSPVGYFYEACADSRPRKPDGKWREFHVKAMDNPFVRKDPEYYEQIKTKMTKDKQMMELEAEFLDVGDSFIPRQLIVDAMSDNAKNGVLPVIIKYYMGVDVSRAGKDETAFVIIGVDDQDNCYLVTIYTESLSNIVDLKDKIGQYIKMYNIQTCYIDETGVGAGLVDLCLKENYPVRGVVFSLEEQEQLYENLRLLFENHRIFLRGERMIADQLAYLKIKFTEGNKMRIVSEQADDLADALTLACKAVESGGRVYLLPSSKAIFG